MTLNEWIRTTGRTQSWVAKRLGIGVAYANRIANGRVDRVSPKVAAAIVALTENAVTLEEAMFPGGMPGAEALHDVE